MDQIIAGVVLNIIATGLTSFYLKSGQILPGVIPNIEVPLLSKIPLIGEVFFSGRSVIALVAIIAAVVVHLGLFHTRWGLRTRAVGEYPSAADTAGINVERLRMVNVTIAGSLAGLAGIYLSMDASSSFERGIVAGRGFLALAIMIMGAWRPLRAFAMAIFFGFVNAVASQLQQSGPRPGRGHRLPPRPARHGHRPADPRHPAVRRDARRPRGGRRTGQSTRRGRPALRQEGPVMSSQTPDGPAVPDVHEDPEGAVAAHLDTSEERLAAVVTNEAILELPKEVSGFGEGNVGEVLLDIKGLSKSFGPVKANRDISLDVRRGEIVALLGENGAGKSTLVNQIFGLITPDSGHGDDQGRRHGHQGPARRHRPRHRHGPPALPARARS